MNPTLLNPPNSPAPIRDDITEVLRSGSDESSSSSPPPLPHLPSHESSASLLIEKNVATAEVARMKLLLKAEQAKTEAVSLELAKTTEDFRRMTSLHAIATSELRRVGEENEELKIKISLANSSMQLLREQVEELESLDRYNIASEETSVTSQNSVGSASADLATNSKSAPNSPRPPTSTISIFEENMLKKQLEKKEDEIYSLQNRLEKAEETIASTTGKYIMSSQNLEPSLLEVQLIEAKTALAQAKTSRDSIAMKYRGLEKEYVTLKLELAHTKSREDDQVHMNELLKSTSEMLLVEKKKMERMVVRETGNQGVPPILPSFSFGSSSSRKSSSVQRSLGPRSQSAKESSVISMTPVEQQRNHGAGWLSKLMPGRVEEASSKDGGGGNSKEGVIMHDDVGDDVVTDDSKDDSKEVNEEIRDPPKVINALSETAPL